MQKMTGLVSVIIPAYNAEFFLPETINSIRSQTYSNWEIIVVNDGSTDNTTAVVKKMDQRGMQLLEQKNAGVSAARNKGIQVARGEYIVLLDADDLLTSGFLKARVDYLDIHPDTGFVGGIVEKFPGEAKRYKPAAENPEREILFFDASCVTVPSNYMVRRSVLTQHHIRFNESLSSTADRFFILQLSKHCKGGIVHNENAILKYRVNENSMSHKISRKLMLDNEQFYREIMKNRLMPSKRRATFRAIYFLGLSSGFFKVRKINKAAMYFLKSFFSNPAIFFRKLVR